MKTWITGKKTRMENVNRKICRASKTGSDLKFSNAKALYWSHTLTYMRTLKLLVLHDFSIATLSGLDDRNTIKHHFWYDAYCPIIVLLAAYSLCRREVLRRAFYKQWPRCKTVAVYGLTRYVHIKKWTY